MTFAPNLLIYHIAAYGMNASHPWCVVVVDAVVVTAATVGSRTPNSKITDTESLVLAANDQNLICF